MTEINLLPWRELKREREKKRFSIYLVMALVVAAAIVFLVNLYAQELIDRQTDRNQMLQNEIALLDKQIKSIAEIKKLRQALVARMEIVQNLQATRSLIVHLLDELVKIMPDGVYLTSVERSVDKVTLLGYAESNTNISQLMRNIQHNRWIQDPELTEIKKTNEDKPDVVNQFKLSFVLSPKISDQKK